MHVEAWLARAAAAAPTVTAVETPERALSYAEMLAGARAAAEELLERGARSGERVAIALPPGIAFAQALHACFLIGVTAVPVDLRLKDSERELIAAGSKVLVDAPLREPAPARAAAMDEVGGGGLGEQIEANAAPTTHDLDACAIVIHTSGTTSAPKPIELTYGNLLWSALGSGVALGVDPAERWLCALPLSHVGGLSILIRSAIYATTAVIHERFDTDRVLEALRSERITLVSLVSTTLARLLDAGLREPPELRCALTGGGSVPERLVQRAREAGVPVAETYGLTECCSQAATAPLALVSGRARELDGPCGGDRRLGAGVPLFCTRTEIAPDGEIMLSGPTVARCALAEDGRLHTGDLGHVDQAGLLHVTGRKADTIVSGGENVAPAEVEAVLEAHPVVLEAAVVGREDLEWGEAVVALIVLAADASADEEALRAHCAARLAPYKVPKRLVLVEGPLPRTASGKLLRRQLNSIAAGTG